MHSIHIINMHTSQAQKAQLGAYRGNKKLSHFVMQLVTPLEATEDVLRDVHTPEYLHEIKTSKQKVAQASLAFVIYTLSHTQPQKCYLGLMLVK